MRQMFIPATVHQLQRRAYLLVGKHLQIGRLLQFDGQSLLQTVFKDSFARSVGEVGQHDRVFCREFLRQARAEVEATDNEYSHQYRNSKNNYSPELLSPNLRNFNGLRSSR